MIDLLPPETPVIYPTTEELLDTDDRRTFDIRVPWWRRKDGSAMTLRVQALSLDAQCAALWLAKLAGQARAKRARVEWDGKADLQVFYLQILKYGIVTPQFEDEHLPRLAKKLGEAIKDLADLLWWVSTISPARVDELVAAAAGVDPAAAADDESDPEWRSAAELALADGDDA
jgi:hypothetical protein